MNTHKPYCKLTMVAVLGMVSTISINAMALASAELYHNEANLYGRFEARIRFAAGDGVVSSFFLWKEGSEKDGAYWNELDFEKIGADCRMQTNSIYGQPSANHEQRHQLSGTCSGYHDYRIEWTPTYIAWVVDGQEIRRDTGAAASAYSENAKDGMTFHFNIWPGTQDFGGNIKNTTLPVYQHISWVRYSAYNNGNFELKWQQDFQCPDLPEGWQMGDWGSPMGQSTHNPENVGTVDGIAVLALSEDNATGALGTPPVDPNAGGSGGNDCTGGAGGSGGASSGGSSSSGGTTSSGGSSSSNSSSSSGGTTSSGGSSSSSSASSGGSTSEGGSTAAGGHGGSNTSTSAGGTSTGQAGNSSQGGAKGGASSNGGTTGAGGKSASSAASGGSSAGGSSSSSATSSASSSSGGASGASSSARGGSSASSESSAKGGSSSASSDQSSSPTSSGSSGDSGCSCSLGTSRQTAAPFAIMSLLVLPLLCRIRRKGV